MKGKRKYHKFATFDEKNVKNIRFFLKRKEKRKNCELLLLKSVFWLIQGDDVSGIGVKNES